MSNGDLATTGSVSSLQYKVEMWVLNRDGNPEKSKEAALDLLRSEHNLIDELCDFFLQNPEEDDKIYNTMEESQYEPSDEEFERARRERDELRAELHLRQGKINKLEARVRDLEKTMDLNAHWLETSAKVLRRHVSDLP